MNPRLLPLLLVLALPLAACDRGAPPPDALPDADDVAAALPSDRQPADSASALPGEFVVLTNEPFWQARVEGGEVVLSGPDVEGRRFTIDSENAAEGARVVHAGDAAGSISVTLLPGPCEDSMSGAVFPLAAELTIDGIGPTPGCARPADMPPPGEPGV
ncbi:hypothetical protein [Luteimonas terricola]|nr:hypothetical protein [Luteimonas terricola]